MQSGVKNRGKKPRKGLSKRNISVGRPNKSESSNR